MKWPVKIKAGALQFVLFIGVVIAILLLAFLLITHTHSFFSKKTDLTVEIIQEADFGLKYAFQKQILPGSSITVNSSLNNSISITVEKEFWGVFEKYRSEASYKKVKFSKIALVGMNTLDGLPSLYLTDKQRPLIVAGNAKITGSAFLPQQGIRMGNISGNSYRHSRLVYGRELNSSTAIPKLSKQLTQQLNTLDNGYNNSGEMVFLRPRMQIENSFELPPVVIRDETIHLRDISLKGNIVVLSTDKIIVEQTAFLKDVLLIAPKIIIKDRVNGSFQAIASRGIEVGKNCELKYPSALVVVDKAKNSTVANTITPPKLFIDRNSIIQGTILYLNEEEKQTYNPQIKVSEKAIVRGEIYCTKNIELKGAVIGNVTTNGFIAMENGSIYQNHLYNGSINSTTLPLEYVGLGVVRRGQRKKVMKWLY